MKARTAWRRLTSYVSWRRYLIWVGVTAAVGLVLCFVPLFDLLGYEFSLALAVVASLATGHIAAAYPARVRDQLAPFPGARWTVARLYLVCTSYGLSLLLVPLILISLNALRVRNCDPLEGVGFYIMGPVASVLVTSAWGRGLGLSLPRQRSASISWVLLWLGAIGVELYDAWAAQLAEPRW